MKKRIILRGNKGSIEERLHVCSLFSVSSFLNEFQLKHFAKNDFSSGVYNCGVGAGTRGLCLRWKHAQMNLPTLSSFVSSVSKCVTSMMNIKHLKKKVSPTSPFLMLSRCRGEKTAASDTQHPFSRWLAAHFSN